MKIYQLTQRGQQVARSPNAPDNANWRVLHTLRRIGYGTLDQIAIQAGVSEEETSNALRILQRRMLVEAR